jgi:hypothetical protein
MDTDWGERASVTIRRFALAKLLLATRSLFLWRTTVQCLWWYVRLSTDRQRLSQARSIQWPFQETSVCLVNKVALAFTTNHWTEAAVSDSTPISTIFSVEQSKEKAATSPSPPSHFDIRPTTETSYTPVSSSYPYWQI